jgi:hypothetical protein
MTTYQGKQNTVLSAVFQFLSYHDKEAYEGVIMFFDNVIVFLMLFRWFGG